MSASYNSYETDQRDVRAVEYGPVEYGPVEYGPHPMPQYPSSTQPFKNAPQSTVTQLNSSQDNDGSRSEKLFSTAYDPIHSDDVQQEAASPTLSARIARAYSVHVTDWWLLEIVSLVLSIASLAATIIILALYDGDPIYDWPYKITMNAVISVVASIAQVTLMVPITSSLSQLKWLWFNEKPRQLDDFETFDSASRGPWGSMLLVGKLRSMHWASLGAATSMLALTMPPFTQQLLTFKSRDIATSTASINSALNFTQYKGISSAIYYGTLPQSMTAAIYSGLLEPDITPSDVTPECPTGDCDWPLYNSLGICASMANITDMITASCPKADVTINCNYSVPGGAYLAHGYDMHMNLTFIDDVWNTQGYTQGVALVNSTAFKNINSVAGLYVIAVSPYTYQHFAYEASLQYCIQTLNSTVREGFHTTKVVDHVMVPAGAPKGVTPSTNTTVNGTVFSIYRPTTTALRASIQELISGYVEYTVQETDSSTLAVGVFWEAMFPRYTSNGSFSGTMNDHGIETLLGSFAASMSNAIRTPIGGNNDTQAVHGLGYSSVSFVRVQWPWVIPPVIVTILACVLLAATIMATSRRGMNIWKSSSMAALMALQSLPRSKLGGLEKVTAMDNRAKDMHVILDGKGEGLGLTEDEKS